MGRADSVILSTRLSSWADAATMPIPRVNRMIPVIARRK
jgi:hypothetical protein